jgi:predicted phage terminase large subunit-like protein
MQNPAIAGASIIKEAWWRKWDQLKLVNDGREADFELPEFTYILLVIDSAYTIQKRSNPTACTVWGIFNWRNPDTNKYSDRIMLIETYEEKMEFSELKKRAKEWHKKWKPDCMLIEEKSSGPMLRSELNEAGVPVEPVMPKPREDKMSRLVSVADIFQSGFVFYLPTSNNQKAVQQCADYPAGKDDILDTVAYACRRFRRGGFVRLDSDSDWLEDKSTAVPMARIY